MRQLLLHVLGGRCTPRKQVRCSGSSNPAGHPHTHGLNPVQKMRQRNVQQQQSDWAETMDRKHKRNWTEWLEDQQRELQEPLQDPAEREILWKKFLLGRYLDEALPTDQRTICLQQFISITSKGVASVYPDPAFFADALINTTMREYQEGRFPDGVGEGLAVARIYANMSKHFEKSERQAGYTLDYMKLALALNDVPEKEPVLRTALARVNLLLRRWAAAAEQCDLLERDGRSSDASFLYKVAALIGLEEWQAAQQALQSRKTDAGLQGYRNTLETALEEGQRRSGSEWDGNWDGVILCSVEQGDFFRECFAKGDACQGSPEKNALNAVDALCEAAAQHSVPLRFSQGTVMPTGLVQHGLEVSEGDTWLPTAAEAPSALVVSTSPSVLHKARAAGSRVATPQQLLDAVQPYLEAPSEGDDSVHITQPPPSVSMSVNSPFERMAGILPPKREESKLHKEARHLKRFERRMLIKERLSTYY